MQFSKFQNIKLNSKIAGRDGLDVPLDVVILLDFLDVVEKVDYEECNKHRSTTNNETFLYSVLKFGFWDGTCDLKKHL